MNGNGRGKRYQGYSITDGLERAVELFKLKYGHDPAEVIRTGGAIKVGLIIETLSQGAQEHAGHTIRPATAENMRKPPKTRAGGLLARVAAAQRQTSPARARQLALALGGET
jgi:hypothetical protein